MRRPKFEQAKLERLLSMYGVRYRFVRLERNQYGEITVPHVVSKTMDIVGVYHEQKQSVQVSVSNEVRYRAEKQPFILAKYDVASQLSIDDMVTIGGVDYKVVTVRNVCNFNIYGDIGLEVVDNGGKT